MLAITTVNAISIEDDLHCGETRFEIPPNSQTLLFASEYSITKTYPDSTSVEIPGEERQRFLIPLIYAYGESPIVRVEVVNALLRNWLCAQLLAGVFWAPLAGLWTVFCMVFADQIKGKVVVPVMKWIFEIVGIRWFDEKEPDDKDKKPLIIIP